MSLLTVPTFDEVIAKVRARIRDANTDLTTLPGTVLGDAFVTPQSLSDVQQQALTFYISKLQALLELLALKQDADTLALLATALDATVEEVLADISRGIDVIGANFDEVREAAKKSVGNATFGRTDAPTQDITINIGVVVAANSGVEYVTTAAVTMTVAGAASFFDTTLAQFVIDVPVEAVLAGADGNAPVNTLTTIVTPVNGLPFINNRSVIDQGRDLETDEEFADRILAKWQAVGVVTPEGILKSLKDTVVVGDCLLIEDQSPFAIRGEGKADLLIKNRASEQITEVISAFNHPSIPSAIRPASLPALTLVSLDSGAGSLQIDTSSALAGSVQSLDAIRFTVAPTFPVTVTYTRNKLVSDAQNVYNDPAKRKVNQRDPVTTEDAVATPILVKQAPQLLLEYTVQITVLPGFFKSDVITNVRNNLATFSDTLKIGKTVFQSDLNETVEKTEGVLRINTVIKFQRVALAGVLNSIQPAENEVPVLSNINVFAPGSV